MDRAAHDKLMSTAKFKPGDIVWTNVKTYSPWPGKVLRVSDEILKIYPCGTKIMQYVEFYAKKEREYLPEDELRPFDEGQAKFSLRKRTSQFHQAVFAAKKDATSAELGFSENSIMDIENAASFSSESILQTKAQLREEFYSHPHSINVRDFDMPVLMPCAPSRLMRRRSSVKVPKPSKRRHRKKSTVKKVQNKDLKAQDIYEFSESDPMALGLEKNVLKGKNAMKTYKPKISRKDTKKKIAKLDKNSEIKRSPKRVRVKKEVPEVEADFDPETNMKYERLHENTGKISSQMKPVPGSRLNTKSAPLCISAEIHEEKKITARRHGRKSRKRQHVKSACNQTDEKISDDVPEKLLKLHDLETKTKVIYPETNTELNDLSNEEIKGVDQTDGKTDSIEEQSETNTQQKSDHMMLTPATPLDPNKKLSVGFLGLGLLGKRIVRQLLADGHSVTVWNRSFYKCYDMVDIGASSKSTAEQVAESCDVTFCCVTNTAAVQEVFFSTTGAFKGLRKGKTFIVLTTIEPDLSSAIESVIKSKGGFYLEAPMFPAGGEIVDNALMTVVGGDRSCLNSCIPIFRSFVKDLVYIGNVPDGNKMVLLTKTLSAVKIAALAESMALADRCDVPTDIMFEIFKKTQIASPFLISKAEAMLQCKPWSKDDIFPISHFSNDLSSTLNLTSELRTPVIAAAKQVFVHSKLRGYTHHDVSAVYLKYTEPF